MKTHASHIPALELIASCKEIYKVIEFGSGIYSTSHFLNKNVFRHLTSLVSFESQEEWYASIKKQYTDNRLNLIHTTEQDSLKASLEYAPVDLVFVDGKAATMRVPTALNAKHLTSLVVLHDANDQQYYEAIASFKYQFIYDEVKPFTAVLSDEDLSWLLNRKEK